MQVRDAFPAGTCTGGDFITGRYEVGPGERVVDFDVDVDTMPSWGLLVVHESTVRLMMTALGWEYDPDVAAKNRELLKENARLRQINAKFKEAMERIVEAVPS